MNKSVRILMAILVLCALLVAGTDSARAESCRLSISIRGNTNLQEHTHFLRVYTSPSNKNMVQIYFDGAWQYLDEAGRSYAENYIDYYISTTFVVYHPYSWYDTGRWYVILPGGCAGSGYGGGGGGSW
ncbi:MAG: hypothetical protein UW37_C0021G0010 [Candidatus Gottesmanbacteria bacterium GW2011_GWA2_44_17]|uniref:Uncharacterized protein n=3 Tax=Candidatus Gottesmaniibacteriota TaxID=1752720 RepID=A0A0G1IM94_9BACT|nr:MAG: hypothetical protein UV63_C0034G0012 [Microgenomates group bacterium GW2011_GWC1_43_11]KKT38018.1 MAG: hypothetical protein UW22_C0015G0028 [Candidatus Gottesmanbacteria bacterium GW2011_GWB1_44_11c]KKT46585.1 MAG: hypothetical protein UW37_C0021G0010 [Candidatus Gottesmanbacteria bacterium GW2011_GWA2_44_17]KKT60245.1 MAG: hypothetical protein UW52_C0028G0010 [Candidatus Gottesmanbacteria bacterium GW2011_GWA1_44_24b]HCM82683.1 hypothetical protein [Patescibacteria group bacterium]